MYLTLHTVTSQGNTSSTICVCKEDDDESARVHELKCADETFIRLINTSYLYTGLNSKPDQDCCESKKYICAVQYPPEQRRKIETECAGKQKCDWRPIVLPTMRASLARKCFNQTDQNSEIRLELSLVEYSCERGNYK